MTYKQGDIVILDFSPTIGHEQSGYRPALVISKDRYNDITRQIIVCPITTKAKRLPMRIPLDDSTETKGFIICDQVRTFDAIARAPRTIESVPNEILEEVLKAVTAVLI